MLVLVGYLSTHGTPNQVLGVGEGVWQRIHVGVTAGPSPNVPYLHSIPSDEAAQLPERSSVEVCPILCRSCPES